MRRGAALALLLCAAARAQPSTEDPSGLFGVILGRVCEDEDADGACGASEPGVGGVRLVLETGQWCLTDLQGRYHLAGLSARQLLPNLAGTDLRFAHGRHRVKVDPRSLPAGLHEGALAATVLVPSGAAVGLNFAVRRSVAAAPPPAAAPREAPPAARREGQGLRFLATGQVSPQDAVWVQGQPAEVDARGRYSAWTEVRPGRNELTVRAQSADGVVRVASQRVDVVERPGGVLFVPRALTPLAQARLPAARGEQAEAGQTRIQLEAPAGTRVRLGEAEVVLGPTGRGSVPVNLAPGENALRLTLALPGREETAQELRLSARSRPFAAALLDVQLSLSLRSGALGFAGRGAAHAAAELKGWRLVGELELRDDELAVTPRALLAPRDPQRLEHWLDPDEVPNAWADESTGGARNAAGGRIQLEASHERYGAVGFGTQTVGRMDVDVGRYRRALFGAYADLHTDRSALASVGVKGFAAPTSGDPVRGLALSPAHEELRATGGSLFFLGHGELAAGSEALRLQLRDGLTGLPLEERALVRGQDYEIDYRSGRVLLARPVSLVAGEGFFRAEGPGGHVEPVLLADYERVSLGDAARTAFGAEVNGTLGPAALSVGAVRENGAQPYQLLTARGRLALAGYALSAELAQSTGQALASADLGESDDGGLSFSRPAGGGASLPAHALSVRLTGPGLWERGGVDVGFRRRTPGFSDSTVQDAVGLRQLFARAHQAVGRFSFGLALDDRSAADPRAPYSDARVAARVAGGWAAYAGERFDVRLEARDAALTAAPSLEAGDLPLEGGRTSVALSGRYRVVDPLWLTASHRQVLATRGEGLGAVNDSISTVGAEWSLDARSRAGLKLGYAPALGFLVLGDAEMQRGEDTYYGACTADVDGPDVATSLPIGTGPRTVTGARTRAADGTTVFVEDVGARELDAIRLARAVGVSQQLRGGLQLSARYERAARHPLDTLPTLARDAGSVSLSLVRERVRAYARVELRYERGQSLLAPAVEVRRNAYLVSAAAEADLTDALGVAGRLHFAEAIEPLGAAARLLEGNVAATWRFSLGALVLHYSVTRELLPPARAVFAERTVHRASLLPTVRLGDRFSLSGGAHLAAAQEGASTVVSAAGSLRPAVRVVGGLELAVEVAARSWTGDGGEWHSVRAEVAWRFADPLRVAAGYTLTGFSGLGLLEGQASAQDRLYLRAEVAY